MVLQCRLQCVVVRPVEMMALHCVASIIKLHSCAHHPTGGLDPSAFSAASLSARTALVKVNGFVCEYESRRQQLERDDSPQRHLAGGFLDKRSKSKLPCSTEKVWGGEEAVDCCWTQQEAGSVRLTQPSFLKQPIKASEATESVMTRGTSC